MRIAELNHVDNFVFDGNTSNGKMIIKARDCGKISCQEDTELKMLGYAQHNKKEQAYFG